VTAGHATFVVEREELDFVRVGGELARSVPRGKGSAAADEILRATSVYAHFEAAQEAYSQEYHVWEQRRVEWGRSVQRRPARGRLYPNGPKVDVVRLVFDGEPKVTVAAGAVEGEIAKGWVKANPQPDKPQAPTTSSEKITVRPGYGWRGTFVSAGSEQVKFTTHWWNFSFPITETMQALDELADAGWRLLYVSEDRRLFGQVAAISISRYLMTKDA
jgi:hypothetical protein